MSDIDFSSPSALHRQYVPEAPAAPKFTPRPYQAESIDRGCEHLKKGKGHAIQIIPTGGGKSLCIANIATQLDDHTLILQPSKEILEQNHEKIKSYGFYPGIYSASLNQKRIGRITMAMIGSIITKLHLFKEFKYIIIDECDLVNSKGGMYNTLIKTLEHTRVLGFTATPYRLSSSMYDGAQLKFLTRTNPRIFSSVNYYVQNKTLFDAGYLAKLKYFDCSVIDRNQLTLNSTGTDFTDNSLKAYYRKINMPQVTAHWANRLLLKRKNLLVFCALVEEANEVSQKIPGSVVITGDTDKDVRATTLSKFKNGQIKCVVNVGVLQVGFDYPQLECILLGRSTMSLRLYYQIFGRGLRIHPDKEDCWLVDLGGNYRFFGRLEDLELRKNEKGLYAVWNSAMNRQLTNIIFHK